VAPANPYGDFEITDPKAMRALAHPVRMALLKQLARHGPATASQLSPHVGATPSVTSWHLRHLAGFGLVQDAAAGPDRRERRWEAVAHGFRLDSSAGGEEARAAARLLSDQMIVQTSDQPLRWAAETAPGLEAAWQDASGVFNTRIVATSDEVEQIQKAIEAALAPFVRREHGDAPQGARGVTFLRYVLPEGYDGE
jgi:DNA-binding transcriptional ArsR family regulator